MEGIRKILNQYLSLTKIPYKFAMLCQGGRKRGGALKEGIWWAHVITLLSFWKKLCLLLYTGKMSEFFCLLLACLYFFKLFYILEHTVTGTLSPLFLYSTFDIEKLWETKQQAQSTKVLWVWIAFTDKLLGSWCIDLVGSIHQDSDHTWRCLLLNLQRLHCMLSDLNMEIYNLHPLTVTVDRTFDYAWKKSIKNVLQFL